MTTRIEIKLLPPSISQLTLTVEEINSEDIARYLNGSDPRVAEEIESIKKLFGLDFRRQCFIERAHEYASIAEAAIKLEGQAIFYGKAKECVREVINHRGPEYKTVFEDLVLKEACCCEKVANATKDHQEKLLWFLIAAHLLTKESKFRALDQVQKVEKFEKGAEFWKRVGELIFEIKSKNNPIGKHGYLIGGGFVFSGIDSSTMAAAECLINAARISIIGSQFIEIRADSCENNTFNKKCIKLLDQSKLYLQEMLLLENTPSIQAFLNEKIAKVGLFSLNCMKGMDEKEVKKKAEEVFVQFKDVVSQYSKLNDVDSFSRLKKQAANLYRASNCPITREKKIESLREALSFADKILEEHHKHALTRRVFLPDLRTIKNLFNSWRQELKDLENCPSAGPCFPRQL